MGAHFSPSPKTARFPLAVKANLKIGTKAHFILGPRALSPGFQLRYAVSMRNFIILGIYFLFITTLTQAQGIKWLNTASRAVNKSAGQNVSRCITAKKLLRIQEETMPALRHSNRQNAKKPVTKFRPNLEDIELWAKLKSGHITGRGLNKGALIDKIVQRHNNMNSALMDLRRLEKQYGTQDFFHLFAVDYYRKVLKALTPSFYDFLQQISLLGDKQIQTAVVTRMQFLFSHQNNFKNILARTAPVTGSWSLYWLPQFTPGQKVTFNPNRLVFSYERSLYPDRTDVTMDHIRADSKIRINGRNVRVVHFQEDLSYLPQFYEQLLYKHPEGRPLFVAVDIPNRLMIVFNDTKNKWVRISKHEFSDSQDLHIHLNRVKSIYFKTGKQKEHFDKMLINIRIPIQSRRNLTPEELEDIFFTQTIRRFEQMPNVYISYQPLY